MYWIGYILGAAMLVAGALVLAGLVMNTPGTDGDMLRTTFGIVLVLYGIYRLVLTDMQRRRRRNEE